MSRVFRSRGKSTAAEIACHHAGQRVNPRELLKKTMAISGGFIQGARI